MSGSRRKYLVHIFSRENMIGGTTDEIITPVISENERFSCPRNDFTRTAYSSSVLYRSVLMRHSWINVSSLKTPRTVFVFPASSTKSINNQTFLYTFFYLFTIS